MKRSERLQPVLQPGLGREQCRVGAPRTNRGQKGAAAVEFALVLPLLLVLLWGAIEFGFMMFDKAMITNASREATRKAVVYKKNMMTSAQITQTVKDYCANLVSFGAGTVVPTVTTNPTTLPTDPAAASGQQLTVTVAYNYTTLVLARVMSLLGTGSSSFPGTIKLTAMTTMTHE